MTRKHSMMIIRWEAFLSIRHKNNNQPFKVHTGEINIKILGTKFNVSKRNGDIKVSLNSGKIQLIDSQNGSDPIIMKPGDLVEAIHFLLVIYCQTPSGVIEAIVEFK